MARPQAQIDRKQFESLCGLQCTREEIADFFEVDMDTVTNWCKRTYGKSFSAVFGEKRARGKISLRRNQFRMAEKNANMAIWLGKQYLNQKDRPEEEAQDNTQETQESSNRLFEVLAPHFLPTWQKILKGEINEVVEKGGRGSTKSSFCSVAVIELLRQHPDCNAVCLRKVGDTLRTSV